MVGIAFPDGVAGRIVEIDPSTAIATARSCVATVQAAGELPAAPAASKKAVAPAPVVQGKFLDEPPSDDDASMDDGPAVPLPPDIREVKLYLLLVRPYPGMYLAAKTGADAMTRYLTDLPTGTYFSGLPGVPPHMRVRDFRRASRRQDKGVQQGGLGEGEALPYYSHGWALRNRSIKKPLIAF
eukprot:5688934-Prymnesium_polylepis.1